MYLCNTAIKIYDNYYVIVRITPKRKIRHYWDSDVCCCSCKNQIQPKMMQKNNETPSPFRVIYLKSARSQVVSHGKRYSG